MPVAALPPVHYELDPHGRLFVTVGELEQRPMVRIDDGLMNLGTLGMLGLVAFGGGDLVSLTDAVDFFEKQGIGEDTDLLRMIRNAPRPTDSAHGVLIRILAVRAAQQRGLKPAIGLLERTLAEPGLDASLREACEDAIVSLRGAAKPMRARDLPPLEIALAAVPAGAQIVLRIDSSRLPCAAPLIALNRVGFEAAVAAGHFADTDDPTFRALMVTRHLELGVFRGCVGYVLANEFGNARIDRVVLAMRLHDTIEKQPDLFVRIEGFWDLDRIGSGLRARGVPHEASEGELTIALPQGHVIRCGDGVAVLSKEGWDAPGNAESAAALAVVVGNDAPVAFWWDDDAPVPEAIAKLRIARAALWVPNTQAEHVRLTTTWATPDMAAAVASWTSGLGRLLETMTDQDEAMIAAAKAASEIKVKLDGKHVDFDVALPKGDLSGLIAALFVKFGIY